MANNTAGLGGGIYATTASLARSTVSGNTGEGILVLRLATLTQSTITSNTGGGVNGGDRGSEMSGSGNIIAGNLVAPDVSNIFVGATHSLIGTPASAVKLGTLASNGGPTQTHALLAGSSAIDVIAPGVAGCVDAGSTDQRGISRPQGAGCDIGSFELETSAPTFDFSGFLAPVVAAPGVNVAKAGRAIPIKFSLGGDQGLGILDGTPTSRRVDCQLSQGTSTVDETVTAGNSALSYDPLTDRYSYVWKTEKRWAESCRVFSLTLSDGTTHTADFQFTK